MDDSSRTDKDGPGPKGTDATSTPGGTAGGKGAGAGLPPLRKPADTGRVFEPPIESTQGKQGWTTPNQGGTSGSESGPQGRGSNEGSDRMSASTSSASGTSAFSTRA